MKRFFDWLLTVFRPEKKNFVRNIQKTEAKPQGGSGYKKPTKKKSFTEVLAFIPKGFVGKVDKDNQGIAVAVTLRKGTAFQLIKEAKSIKISSQKRGLSAVTHEVAFGLDGGNPLATSLVEKSNKGGLCFLVRRKNGDHLLLGNSTGLKNIESDASGLVFKGEEPDVFYHISEVCFKELLPNIEK